MVCSLFLRLGQWDEGPDLSRESTLIHRIAGLLSALVLVTLTTTAAAQGYRDAETEFSRGELLYEMRDYPRAIFAFHKAYSILPDSRYLAGLVRASYANGNSERALVLGEKYLTLESEQPDDQVVAIVSRLRDEYAGGRARVVFDVYPPGGKLSITDSNGTQTTELMDETTWVRYLSPGDYSVRYEREGLVPRSAKFPAKAGKEMAVKLELGKAEGKSELVVTANVENANVYLDGTQVGSTPFKARIAAGDHVVQVWAKDHMAWTGVVDAPARRGVSVRADLVRSKQPVDAIPTQIMDVRESGGWSLSTWGWITMGLGLASGGAAGYFAYDMNSAATEANSLNSGDPRRDDLNQQVQTSWLITMITGAAGGALLGGGLLMVLLDDGGDDDEAAPFNLLTISPDSDGKGVLLDAAFTF